MLWLVRYCQVGPERLLALAREKPLELVERDLAPVALYLVQPVLHPVRQLKLLEQYLGDRLPFDRAVLGLVPA
jgi:hypothetical protein